jgi:hypothetical protein
MADSDVLWYNKRLTGPLDGTAFPLPVHATGPLDGTAFPLPLHVLQNFEIA